MWTKRWTWLIIGSGVLMAAILGLIYFIEFFFGISLLFTEKYEYSCLREDSVVWMADGSKRQIGSVKIGDQLMGYDVKSGIYSVVTVLDKRSVSREEWLEVGSNLVVTSEHPIWTDVGWLLAGQVDWDRKILAFGGWRWSSMSRLANSSGLAVDLQVDGPQTFLAGDEGVVVHNKYM